MSKIQIGIDFGITNSDIAIKSDEKISFESIESQKNIHLSLTNIIKNKQEANEISNIFVTGSKHSDLPNKIDNIALNKKNEIDCIGIGAKKLSNLDSDFLILSCGTGTACVSYLDDKISHLGGSGLGGGTIRGLCKLITEIDDPIEIEKLSQNGSQIGDYLLKDVVSGPIGTLPRDSIAVHFGNLDMINKLNKEDVCKSVIYLVATNVARLAATTALSAGLDKIIVVGKSPDYSLYKELLKKWVEYAGLEIMFPENGQYATCLGALETLKVN